jgi:hypothetical protein
MKFTNKLNLSTALRDAIIGYASEYDSVGWRSVTTLCGAPRRDRLSARHDEEIEQDVSDMMWAFFGNIGHHIAYKAAGPNAVCEQRFITEIEVDGVKRGVSYKPDRLERIGGKTWLLRDFKFTSVYILRDAFQGKLKTEWINQLNMYKLLLKKEGFDVDEMVLEIIARDWRKAEALQSMMYPRHHVGVFKVPEMQEANAMAFLHNRIRAHAAAENLPDDDLPYCTEAERWATRDEFCVVKKAAKETVHGKRTKLPKSGCDTLERAQRFMASRKDADDLEIEFRKGASKRCEEYCEVKEFCNQYKLEINPAF